MILMTGFFANVATGMVSAQDVFLKIRAKPLRTRSRFDFALNNAHGAVSRSRRCWSISLGSSLTSLGLANLRPAYFHSIRIAFPHTPSEAGNNMQRSSRSMSFRAFSELAVDFSFPTPT
ncbi:hypothetical protein OOJ09_30925 [Mesorhizobium qingshengii]|uniref:Secreted protein n=1 Tax=Mesorhizobium qingshengii TaxID=1165689 RepID=A0ABT4R4A7_9HYPH|nr:hypothetical protein [Mesorhizobium qingshengii]MCZ8548596.1 hypothetical protein [Mesorhizobium qingshengii]